MIHTEMPSAGIKVVLVDAARYNPEEGGLMYHSLKPEPFKAFATDAEWLVANTDAHVAPNEMHLTDIGQVEILRRKRFLYLPAVTFINRETETRYVAGFTVYLDGIPYKNFALGTAALSIYVGQDTTFHNIAVEIMR